MKAASHPPVLLWLALVLGGTNLVAEALARAHGPTSSWDLPGLSHRIKRAFATSWAADADASVLRVEVDPAWRRHYGCDRPDGAALGDVLDTLDALGARAVAFTAWAAGPNEYHCQSARALTERWMRDSRLGEVPGLLAQRPPQHTEARARVQRYLSMRGSFDGRRPNTRWAEAIERHGRVVLPWPEGGPPHPHLRATNAQWGRVAVPSLAHTSTVSMGFVAESASERLPVGLWLARISAPPGSLVVVDRADPGRLVFPGPVPSAVSAHALMLGRIPKERVEGRLVVVGPEAQWTQGAYGRMYRATALHAALAADFLRGRAFVRSWPVAWAEFGVLLIFGALLHHGGPGRAGRRRHLLFGLMLAAVSAGSWWGAGVVINDFVWAGFWLLSAPLLWWRLRAAEDSGTRAARPRRRSVSGRGMSSAEQAPVAYLWLAQGAGASPGTATTHPWPTVQRMVRESGGTLLCPRPDVFVATWHAPRSAASGASSVGRTRLWQAVSPAFDVARGVRSLLVDELGPDAPWAMFVAAYDLGPATEGHEAWALARFAMDARLFGAPFVVSAAVAEATRAAALSQQIGWLAAEGERIPVFAWRGGDEMEPDREALYRTAFEAGLETYAKDAWADARGHFARARALRGGGGDPVADRYLAWCAALEQRSRSTGGLPEPLLGRAAPEADGSEEQMGASDDLSSDLP